ncbi:MAG: alpha/beta hydrolase [Lachnospiraceae bacterium]|nr:alpha/beta hydrolase [Lachnospiraceae bacterium]
MKMQIFGQEEHPKILALHPMLADGQSMVRLAGSLQEEYCILAPDLSGQGADTGEFESGSKEAEALFSWLKGKGWLELELVYGASLGAAVGMRLLAEKELSVKTVVFDGCPLFKNAPVLTLLLQRMYVKKQKKAREIEGIANKRMTAIYGEVFGPAMAKSFVSMSEKSLKNIVAACGKCDFPTYPEALERRMFFEYGEKDFDCRMGKKNLARYYPRASLKIRKGYGHCQFMAEQGERYEAVLREYIKWEKTAGGKGS